MQKTKSIIVPNEEFVKKNYVKTITLHQQFELSDLVKLIENFAEEYATTPASTDEKYHCAFPGGLAYHNLYVLQWIGRFAGAMGADKFSKKSLLKVSILHSVGKLGDVDIPYYLPVSEDWKIKKGIYFEFNPLLSYMKIPQRSLYLAQKFGVELSEEEYLAVLLADGQLDETNRPYKYKDPNLAVVLQNAVYWARREAKNLKVNWTP